MPAKLSLALNKTLSPPFHQLSAEDFQRLSREILGVQPGIESCDLYGINGQRQLGVDLIAFLTDGRGADAGQCKCQEVFTVADLQEAVDDFLEHWDHWREWKVRRFIVLVACEADRTQLREEQRKQRARLAQLGVRFELWAAAAITRRLRPHRAIVATQLGPEWVTQVCGPEPAADRQHGAQPIIDLAVSNEIVTLRSTISRETDAKVVTLRRAWREGRKREVLEWLDMFDSNESHQTAAEPEVTAKVLRFHAGLLLEDGGSLDRVRALAARARKLHSGPDDARILAVLGLRDSGPDAGLNELAGSDPYSTARLRAGILLEAGRPSEALEVLDAHEPGEPSADRAEHARLRAIALFVSGRRDEALVEGERALEAEPRWVSTRFLAAFLDYHAGLSTAVTLGHIPAWPEPIPWSLVRQDHAGIRSTERALARFRELLSGELEEGERQRLETWVLASLATLPDRIDEAIGWCRQVLERTPAHPYVVAWAVTRQLPIELEGGQRALLAAIEAEPSPELVAALCGICLVTGRPEFGLEVLDKSTAVFDQAELLHCFWRVQLLAATDRLDEARTIAAEVPLNDRLSAACQGVIARSEFARTGDASILQHHLVDAFARTGDLLYLIDRCLLAAEQADWNYVAQHASTLIEVVGTAVTVRLAATALDALDRHAECLRMIDGRVESFTASPLGLDLRAIRGLARHAQGEIAGAIADLETVTVARPRTREQFVLAQLYSAKGDLERLAGLARDLNGRDDLSVRAGLWLAEALQQENRELARALWRDAIRREVPDEAVGSAQTLGSRLGLESETRALFARLMKLAAEGRGGMHFFTVDEVLAMGREWAADREKLVRRYEIGELPVHILSASQRIPLVAFYHVWLDEGEATPDFRSRRILRARHAARPHPGTLAPHPQTWRVTMDLTSLLLAEHLGILALVEEAFGPVRIPHGTVHALLEMSETVVHHQPSRLDIYQALLAAEEKGLLQIRSDPAGKLAEGTYVLDFASAEADSDGPADGSRVTSRDVVESLHADGPLGPAEYVAALDALGTEGVAPPSGTVLRQRRTLYCPNNTLEILVDAGLLRAVCERFSVVLDSHDQAGRRQALEHETKGRTTAGWLRGLIGRLNDGLSSRRYELLPLVAPPPEEERVDTTNPILRALVETLRQEGDDRDVLWVDDRAVNRHAFGNRARIIDVLEALWALRARGALDDADFYRLLLRLRAANVRYLPLTSDEILHHLRQAAVRDGKVIETGGLAVLRRYVAGCLADAGDLQIPRMPLQEDGNLGELPFFPALGREVLAAALALWKDASLTSDIAGAASDWLVTGLHVDLALMRAAAIDPSWKPSLEVTAVELGGWITQAIGLLSLPDEPDDTRAREYVAWVESRLVQPRMAAEPGLVTVIGAVLRRSWLSVSQEEPGELARVIGRLLVQRLCDLLSEPLETEVKSDPKFLDHIGVQMIPTRGDDELQFPSRAFVLAAAAAMRGEATRVRTVDEAHEVSFEPAEPPTLLRYTHPTTGVARTGRDPLLELLTPDPTRWGSILREHWEWFDVRVLQLDEMIEQIVAIEDLEARYNHASRWRDESAPVYYEQLPATLCRGTQVREEALRIPRRETLLRHLGVEPAGGELFGQRWSAALERTVRERGVEVALDRLAGIPVECPPAILAAMDGLSDLEVTQLVKHRLRLPTSPVGELHLLRLLAHLAPRNQAYGRLGRRLARRLVSEEWQAEVQTFIRMLHWVETDLRSRSPEPEPDTGVRLSTVWYHTHRLFQAFAQAQADMPRLGELFDRLRHEPAWAVFDRGSDYYGDAAHPLHLNTPRFTLAGLGYAVNGAEDAVWSDDFREALLRRCFREVNEELVPDLALLADPARMADSLGSFLRLDQADYANVLGSTPAEALGAVRLRAFVEQAISLLELNAADISGWTALRALLQERPIHPELADRLTAILLQLELGSLSESDAVGRVIVPQAVAWSSLRNGDPALRERIANQLVELAAKLAQRPGRPDPDEERSLEWHVVEGAAILAGAERDLESRAGALAELLERLYTVYPGLVDLTRTAIQRFVDTLPLQAAGRFTRLLLLTRRSAAA